MWESERMGPNIPKWILTSGIGIPMDFRIFKKQFEKVKIH
jgi:hypothetical protein